MEPFKTESLHEPNTIQKLTKRNPKENFSIEVQNILSVSNLDEISNESILNIWNKYKITNTSKENDLKTIFNRYLSFYFKKSDIDNIEFSRLDKLSEVLLLDVKDAESIISSYSEERFVQEIRKILLNGEDLIENENALKKCERRLTYSRK